MRLAALLNPLGRTRAAQLAHPLRDVPLFRHLPVEDLVAIFQDLSTITLPPGEVVCRRGDPGDRFYIVQSGSMEVRLGLGPEGITIRRILAGDTFGEMALITGHPRSADVVTAEETVLWVLERRDFETLTNQSIAMMRALNRFLCDRIETMTVQIEELEARTGGRGGASVEGLRFGPFRVVEQIAAGGMAVVYSAIHVMTEVAAALKVLPAAWGDAPDLRQRLEREAAALQRVAHPNVVHVLEVGAVDARAGGGCYVAMEWLPHALDRVLRAQYPEPLSVDRALTLCLAVSEALAAVHAAGIVHRDVKPSNVLLRADGTPVLSDFGLALAAVETGGRLTATDMIVGTADYVSPEQVTGTAVDGRSDLYSLGVMLYELLTGYVPFAGRTPMETLRAHVDEAPPALAPDIPAPARAIVERALRKQPRDRFASAREMADAIRHAISLVAPAAAGAAG